jgi:hypothetical protein
LDFNWETCVASLFVLFFFSVVFLRSDLFSPELIFPVLSMDIGRRSLFSLFISWLAPPVSFPHRFVSPAFLSVLWKHPAPAYLAVQVVLRAAVWFLASAPAKRVPVLDSSAAAQAAGIFFPSLISVSACHHLHSRDLFFPFVRSGVVSTRKEFSRGVSLCLAVRNHWFLHRIPVVIFISHCELRLPQKDFLLLLLVFVPQEFCYCRLVKSYFSPALKPSRSQDNHPVQIFCKPSCCCFGVVTLPLIWLLLLCSSVV